ncbi:cell death regulator Aven isoform X2 [Oncorhynchus nerka]|uniref:cell death regulator Aven isoform X2 n=1 Tax=Oncorhynchus nerka TaxID=8023 RepID=UPI0011311B3B|nr:cell death regulator Aven isoform X2 [Oncorhynchus nerka]
MEGRPNRGRQTSWKRGGSGGGAGAGARGGGGAGGGSDSGTSGGEHRARGRGRYGTGRGKRDHYRGRGRGYQPTPFGRGQDEGNRMDEDEDEGMEVFTKRKLESNWDRYKESEKEEPSDDTPTQRGTDYHVLLESAGDSFTQFRFSEEKEWDIDSLAANQFSAVFVDLPALAQSLQELPLHQRLNLEAELVQVTSPVELPTMTMAPKQNSVALGLFKPPVPGVPAAQKGLSPSLGVSCDVSTAPGAVPLGSSAAKTPVVDDMDKDLDQLLSLQSSDSEPSLSQTGRLVEVPNEPVEEREELVPEEELKKQDTQQAKEEIQKEEVAAPPKAAVAKEVVTEEDLEDWLDSMIS